MRRSAIALLCLLLTMGCASEPPKQAAVPSAVITFFSGARIIAGDGSEPIEEATMIVENGKIKQIGRKNDLKPPAGSARVDLTGKTIMPVLINLHGHVGYLNGVNYTAADYTRDSVLADLNRYAYYGVGALLSLGTDTDDIAFEVRDQQRRGTVPGARILTAGRGITIKGGLPMASIPAFKDVPYQISSEEEGRKAVSELAARKVDAVKIWVDNNLGRSPKLKPGMYRAIIDEAHKHGLRVFAHVFALADAKDLVKSGLDAVAHSIRDREVDDEFIRLMKEKNVVYIATLMQYQSTLVFAGKPDWRSEQTLLESYPPQLITDLGSEAFVAGIRSNPDLPKLRQQFQIAMTNAQKLAAAGVKIGFGTDSGGENHFIGYFEHHELELMVAAGMTPQEAITAATKTSAEVLGIDDLGTLAPGKSADFIVLSSNPLDDIENTRQIAAVYRAGKTLVRPEMKTSLTSQLK